MPRSHRLITPARALTLCLALVLARPALAQADTARFEIKAEPLSIALKTFAQQAHMQLLYEYAIVQNVRGNSVIGVLEKHAALEELLRNTGLEAIFSSDSAATIRPIPNSDSTDALKSSAQKSETKGRARKKSMSGATISMAKPNDETATAVESAKSTPQNSADEEFPALQEIIVTAQKYRQRAFDVPISLQVIGGWELQQQGITNLSNLQYDVPGLYMDNTGYRHSVYLRGVGNSYGNGAMVGQYIDEADITAGPVNGTVGAATGDNAIYDLNRAEVLKGPQGTLYGDGSMGGVIRYITNKPALDRFQMSADVAALFTQYGAPSQRTEAMLNTPLIAGTLGLRFAGIFEHDGGWIDEPVADLKNVNGSNLVDVRIEGLWQPTERFKLNAMQIIHRHAYGLDTGENASGDITPPFDTALTQNGTENSNVSNLTLTYDFARAQLLSSSTYINDQQVTSNLFISAPAYWIFQPNLLNYNRSFSQEFRLVHVGGGPWQWTVGGFYKHLRGFLTQNLYLGFSGSPLSKAFYLANYEDGLSTSWAGYANTSYEFFKKLTLGVGVRYFKDRETDSPPEQAATFNSTDPRFYVQYGLSPLVNLYASASKGFRSGGYNPPPRPSYQPENLWSYDLGTKIRSSHDVVRADVDFFYMDYSNFINPIAVPPPLNVEYANIGKARIEGVDADLTWRPFDGWRVSLNSELLNSSFLTVSQLSGFAVGDRVPYAPKYSFTASLEREFRWNGKPVDVETYYYELSRVQFRQKAAPTLLQSDMIRFLNFRADINWNDNLRFGLFVHNLLNDRGVLAPALGGATSRPRPRTFGMEFDVRFR